jgi:hypothetical protein
MFDKLRSIMWSPFRYGYMPLGDTKQSIGLRSGTRTFLVLTILNIIVLFISLYSLVLSAGFYNGLGVLNPDLRRASSWSKLERHRLKLPEPNL